VPTAAPGGNEGVHAMTGETNEEAAWRDLVAHYAAPAVADGVPAPWPTREDLPGPGTQGQDAAGQDSGGTDTADLDVTGLDLAGPDGAERDPAQRPGPGRPETPAPFGLTPGPPQIRIVRPASQVPPPGDDDHFVPPVPPPLPRLDPATKGAWAALFGGPLYLLVAVMAGWQVPDWAAFCAVAAFIGGFATLVVRMGDRPPQDSGPDDGAVV
jgi:hypothetical protein